jgi:N-acetylglucosaminyldiphosphoundecaprenol N-acetyl-beta-D-mannosaminyltransferase
LGSNNSALHKVTHRAVSSVDFDRDVYCVMGVPVDAITMQAAVERVRHAAFSGTRCFVSTPNLNFVMAAKGDPEFRNSVLHSDLSLADGMPLVWVARILRLPIRERVSGAGLFESLLRHSGPPVTIYFFGGPDGAAEAAAERVSQVGGGLRCVGFESPGYGSVDELSDNERIERINRSGAQFVIVSLGAKKGQAWIERNRARLHAPVIAHLGAVLNFAAGNVRRAPEWIQGLGVEWLWRIKEEPGLWRRYWSDGGALLGELLSRVLPQVVQRALRLSSKQGEPAATVSMSVVDKRATLSLCGAWTGTSHGKLREVLRDCHARAPDLELQLSQATRLDDRCLGVLLLASGAYGAPRRMTLVDPAPGVAQALNQRGAGFLMRHQTEH